MVEIISHLTRVRFGDEEQSKSKDTKEVCGPHGNKTMSSGLTWIFFSTVEPQELFVQPLLFLNVFLCCCAASRGNLRPARSAVQELVPSQAER